MDLIRFMAVVRQEELNHDIIHQLANRPFDPTTDAVISVQGEDVWVDARYLPELTDKKWHWHIKQSSTCRYIKNSTCPLRMHDVVWFLRYRKWPAKDIDHISGRTFDNRICNLRRSDVAAQNANQEMQSNNTSGYKGVCFTHGRWIASITHLHKRIHLGYYAEASHSAFAYKVASLYLNHEYACYTPIALSEHEEEQVMRSVYSRLFRTKPKAELLVFDELVCT